MKFQQLMAGNASVRPPTCLGTPALPVRHAMTRHFTLLTGLLLTLVTLAAAPAARAADPLLSGYAGPGSGEQVVLGGGTVGGGKGGSGGSGGTGASKPTGAAADQSLRATSQAAATSTSTSLSAATSSTSNTQTLTRKPQRKKSSSSSSSSKQKMSGSSSTSSAGSSATTAAAPSGAPKVVAYPTRAGEVGGVPLTLGEGLLAVAVIALLTLLGLGLRRLSGGSDNGSPMPQVPVR